MNEEVFKSGRLNARQPRSEEVADQLPNYQKEKRFHFGTEPWCNRFKHLNCKPW